MLAHLTASLHGGKQARRLKITDFLLTWGKRRQTGEEQLALFRALAARQGGSKA